MREQVTLIQHAALDEHRKQELISLSFIVASRDIAREILLRVIREVFTMKTLPPLWRICLAMLCASVSAYGKQKSWRKHEERSRVLIKAVRGCTRPRTALVGDLQTGEVFGRDGAAVLSIVQVAPRRSDY